MSEQPRISFVIAGVQKGGTTALFDYLTDYPDIALPDEKELHFFDDETQDWERADYAAYHARFPAPDGRPRGEATPIYSWWPQSLERIAAYNPAMKLILALRDPVQRAWSHWRMEYARGHETEPFAWAIREGRGRLAGADEAHRRAWSYVERGFYGAQVERVLALFPRTQLLVLKSEDLRRAPAPALFRVRAFLGLPPAPAPAPRESHVAQDADYPSKLTDADVAYLQGLYRADAEQLAALTGVRY